MAKRSFVLGCTVLTVLATQAAARADTIRPFAGADGCGMLAAVVFQEVAASAWLEPGSRIVSREDGNTEVTICNQTARTVTGAFTKAMATMNIYIGWNDPRDARGDECLSAFLSQCYPHRNPFVPITSGSDLAFIYTSWSAVQATALKYTDASGRSDTSRFSRAVLERDLRRSMWETAAGSRVRLLP